MNIILLVILNFFTGSIGFIIQLLLLIGYLYLMRRFKISGQKTAVTGLFMLGVSAIFVLFKNDYGAGIIAEYAFLLFIISFTQEFYHFLKYENK